MRLRLPLEIAVVDNWYWRRIWVTVDFVHRWDVICFAYLVVKAQVELSRIPTREMLHQISCYLQISKKPQTITHITYILVFVTCELVSKMTCRLSWRVRWSSERPKFIGRLYYTDWLLYFNTIMGPYWVFFLHFSLRSEWPACFHVHRLHCSVSRRESRLANHTRWFHFSLLS